jgi:hypothetical protein
MESGSSSSTESNGARDSGIGSPLASTGSDADNGARAEEWRLKGNEYFGQKEYGKAIEMYTLVGRNMLLSSLA